MIDYAEKYYSISTKVLNPIFDSSTPESGEFWDYKIIMILFIYQRFL